jgi:penicillin-binding protein 1A
MLELNHISQKDYENAKHQLSTAKIQAVVPEVNAPYLAEMVRQKIYTDYGEQAYTSGLKVYTSIDGNLQTAANNALANTLHAYDERHGYRLPSANAASKYTNFSDIPIVGDTLPGYVISLTIETIKIRLQDHSIIDLVRKNCSWAGNRLESILKVGSFIRVRKLKDGTWGLAQIPETEGAFIALNPLNGAILALTGGFDFSRNKYNRVTQSKRQPGSGFKPIIYTTALEEGH